MCEVSGINTFEKKYKMKKLIILATASCLVFVMSSNAQLTQLKGKSKNRTSSSSQSPILIGGSLVYGMPQASFKNGYKSSIGFESTMGLKLSKIFVTSTVGYSLFAAQGGNAFGNITNIPLKAGVKYYVSENFFVMGNVGVGLLKDRVSSVQSRFMRDFGVGFRYNTGELALVYDGWKRKSDGKYSDVIALKAGFYFK